MEKEVTGLYLSGHPMDAYRDTVRAQGAVPIASVLEDFAQEEGPTQFQDGQRILLAGVVAAAKTKTTKNNSLMAYALPLPSPGSSICALPGATIPCSPGYATSLSSSPASRPPCSIWPTPSAGWGPGACSTPPCSRS